MAAFADTNEYLVIAMEGADLQPFVPTTNGQLSPQSLLAGCAFFQLRDRGSGYEAVYSHARVPFRLSLHCLLGSNGRHSRAILFPCPNPIDLFYGQYEDLAITDLAGRTR